MDWEENKIFCNLEEYKLSRIYQENQIDRIMSRQKCYNTEMSRTENWCCKFSKRKGFKICEVLYKIFYLSTSFDIIVFSNKKKHQHEDDPEYSTSVNFHWTKPQEDIIRQGIKDMTDNKKILRNIKDANLTSGGKFPNLVQLGRKKRNMKILVQKYTIMNFNDLRKYCNENNNIPTDENEQYIPFSYINEAEERFIVIWSSPKMLKRISSKFTSHDVIYNIYWNEYIQYLYQEYLP